MSRRYGFLIHYSTFWVKHCIGVLGCANIYQTDSPFHTPSSTPDGLLPVCPKAAPCTVDCGLAPVCRTGIHLMLRAAVLLSFLRRLRTRSVRHASALPVTQKLGLLRKHVACYVAPWWLPRLDFHQLADDSFRTHQAVVGRQLLIVTINLSQVYGNLWP